LKSRWNLKKWNNTIRDDEIESNFLTAAMFRTVEASFNCKAGDEAMNLLLTSNRIYKDLQMELECYRIEKELGNNPNFEVKLALREWLPGLNGKMEFRCFVKNNVMTGISQYNDILMIEELLSEKNCRHIKRKLHKFWNDYARKILLCLSDYVVDLAILDDGSVSVVELNPFLTNTSAALFNWETDSIILRGQNLQKGVSEDENIEIRVRTVPYPLITEQCQLIFMPALKRMTQEAPYWEILERIDPVGKTKTHISRDHVNWETLFE